MFTEYYCDYINNRGSLCQERPYHSDSTTSSLLSEVKHCRARLVLRWGTTLESLVLFFCFFCQASCGYLVPCPHGASKTAKTRPCWNSWCCSFAFFCQASCGYLDQESISSSLNITVIIEVTGAVFARNDHTTVTAPLPVCSAKLSTVGPG